MDSQLPALYRLGIVGAGQIARMTQQAALQLGITPRLLAESAADSAALAAPDARFTHPDAIASFAEVCEVITFDHERIDIGLLQALENNGMQIRPGTKTLRAAFDKLHQRRVLSMKGFQVPAFAEAKGPDDIIDFASRYSYPLVIKATKAGTQSKSQVWVVSSEPEALKVLAEQSQQELMVEQHMDILTELTVVLARRPGGNTRTYPVTEVTNKDGVCQHIRVPAEIGPHIAAEARELGKEIADYLGSVGVLSVELFLTADGLVVNEIAARPSNAGHFTIEACTTSQFENHVRAILDYPLGPTELNFNAATTLNVIGTSDCDPAVHLVDALAIEGVHVHLYGKLPKPGRKLGHVTAVGDSAEQTHELACQAEAALLGRRYQKGGAA